MKTFKPQFIKLSLLLSASIIVSACSDNDPIIPPPPVELPNKQFSITITNLTHNQPFSPVAVLLHQSGSLWTLNQPASEALELMAESGDNSQLLSLSYADVSASGEGIVMPGGSESIEIETTVTETIQLSIATMLVNTNDAFTGRTGLDVTNLAVSESMVLVAPVYDAGTELNSESSGTIPGPADGGEGFNAIRDDLDRVYRHPGVVTNDDGFTSSVLNQSHRFDNPAIKIEVTRTE